MVTDMQLSKYIYELFYILTDIGNVYGFGQCCDQTKRNIVQKFDLRNIDCGSLRKILVSEDHLFGSFIEEKLSLLPLNNFKALEKSFLNKMRQILKKVIEPLCEENIHSSNQIYTSKHSNLSNFCFFPLFLL